MVSNAFPKRTRSIAQLVANVELDVEALCQPIRPCDLASCRGTCCHDGVYLSGEEAGVIRDLVRERKSELRQLGADLPERVIVYGSFRIIRFIFPIPVACFFSKTPAVHSRYWLSPENAIPGSTSRLPAGFIPCHSRQGHREMSY